MRILCVLSFVLCWGINVFGQSSNNAIQPWSANPWFWQYKGKPVLLLGATDNDNLFQNGNLQSHLDSLKAVGGNYIRNTMSDRDPGNERAFYRNADGKYDLERWNPAYWERFDNLLRLTSEREIIVQIEIWDRFDHSRDQWVSDPFNPKNNVNYTYEEAGLDSLYPDHPGRNKQPFFFTPPTLKNNTVLLRYQQRFVEKIVEHTLKYDNVLFCIDNETSGVEAWATYWANFVKERAKGKTVQITQMWDNWDVKSDMHKRTLDHPERYTFVDISQNSQLTGYENWKNQQYVFAYLKDNPRPVNSTKIYGSDQGPWLNRGINEEHAVQTFFRNVIGGFASSRFHRPPSGLGLSTPSINAIRTVRNIESHLKFWDLSVCMDLLSDVEENEAYATGATGKGYVVYFTKGGRVSLDLTGDASRYKLRWITITDASWSKVQKVKGGERLALKAPVDTGCVAVLY